MTTRAWRLAMGLAYAVAFITVGLEELAEPTAVLTPYIEYWGISSQALAWAFIISGVLNAISGMKNSTLNPAAFGIFLFYNFVVGQAVADGHRELAATLVFYTLISVVYALNQWADLGEQYRAGT